MTRTLVLGGSGLISTAVVHRLVERGDDVTALTRATSAGREVRTVHGERRDAELLWRLLGQEPYDVVVDMLAFTAQDASDLATAARGRVGRVVMCSTVDVYQKPAPHVPADESTPRVPRADFTYATGKKAAEDVLLRAHHDAWFDVTLLRPAATYLDRGVSPVGTWATAIDRLRTGKAIFLPEDGSGRWPSCHRDEVAAAFAVATTSVAARGRSYTLASADAPTWREYWTTIAKHFAVEPRFLLADPDQLLRLDPELSSWCAWNFRYDNNFDCSAARADLGFSPTLTWAQGVSAFDRGAVPDPDPLEVAAYDRLVDAWMETS